MSIKHKLADVVGAVADATENLTDEQREDIASELTIAVISSAMLLRARKARKNGDMLTAIYHAILFSAYTRNAAETRRTQKEKRAAKRSSNLLAGGRFN